MTWAGVDVGGRRKGFHAAVVDRAGLAVGPHALSTPADVVAWLEPFAPSVVAVDSPRTAAVGDALSRACERRLAAAVCGIRYTPNRSKLESSSYYEWILHGFELYAALDQRRWIVIECFPTASWTRWAGPRGRTTRAAWSRDALARLTPQELPSRLSQDTRDAIGAALTARAFADGTTEAFGEIAVPRLG
jgi:predicted nuclease with RNAse H fold